MGIIKFVEKVKSKNYSSLLEDKLKELQNIYGKEIDNKVKTLLKFEESKFYDNNGSTFRFMSINEIRNANQTLGLDLVSKKYIPIIDTMDNDFICYDLNNKKFVLFNIVDEVEIISDENIEGLINKISETNNG